jgi:hypothetical protein
MRRRYPAALGEPDEQSPDPYVRGVVVYRYRCWKCRHTFRHYPVSIAWVDEANPQAVKRWLGPMVKQLGVSVIVTDDLMQYKTVADQLDLVHQGAKPRSEAAGPISCPPLGWPYLEGTKRNCP